MVQRPLLILHGWHADVHSIQPLARQLATVLPQRAHCIDLSQYCSLYDTVTIDDLAAALERAWQAHGLPSKPRRVDVIAHSTGSLVIRRWLTRYHRPGKAPLKHLLLLAPANFGSPLASQGQALLGRVMLGMHRSPHLFQTGTHILQALEVASPYSWHLAEQDRFQRDAYYGAGRILATVLVGNAGLTGMASITNRAGTDGVVYLSTANLNAAYATLDLTQTKPKLKLQAAQGETAFAMLAGENHHTIVAGDSHSRNTSPMSWIARALTVSDKQFSAWCEQCRQHNQQVRQAATVGSLNAVGYQNTVLRVRDQLGHAVTDYFVEFSNQHDNHELTCHIHRDIIVKKTTNSQDSSYRSLLVDPKALQLALQRHKTQLQWHLSASPVCNTNNLVGFASQMSVGLSANKSKQLFQADRTVLLDIILERQQVDQ